jgi:hypothetical protein
MGKRHLSLFAVFALVLSVGGVAMAHPNHPVNTNEDINDVLDPGGQHGPLTGHLPPTQKGVDLVSKLELTTLEGGIADVGYFKDFAYLNRWYPHCPNDAGVAVVDISAPSNPQEVGFLPANTNEVPGEGVHVMEVDTPFFTGDLLLSNNEACVTSDPAVLGMSLWDVTDPLAPVKLNQFGDATPPIPGQPSTYHSIHNVQGFTQPGKAFAVMVDNNETADIDIVDITNPAAPVIAAERGLADFVPGVEVDANGNTVFFHDLQFKRMGGHDYIVVSYWDAGQILLNVDDPYDPVFITDSNYPHPDPLTGFEPPEGNSHESYWSSNNQFLISTDEDFSPTRTLCEITTGPNAGGTGCGEFGWTVPVADNFPGGFSGDTVWGGSGCVEDLNGNGISDRDEVPSQASTGADSVVFSRGVCFFSDKVRSGEEAGYNMVFIGNSHTGSQGGILPDAFFCGGQGSPTLEQASGVCIGHRAMHLLFNDTPEYTGPEFADQPAIGTLGESISVEPGVFDGWGYVNLHDASDPDLEIFDAYAVPESLDPAFMEDFGVLSVHEVKTDPRPNVNLAYFSYYNAGFRVAAFGKNGIQEVGRFIDEGGNDFWGVFPIGDEIAGHGYPGAIDKHRPLILASDRDFGLYIFDFTGTKTKG